MAIERIVITRNLNGSFRGASVQDFNGLPVALTEAEVIALLPAETQAAVARVVELEATLDTKDAELAYAQAALLTIESELSKDATADEAKVATLVEVAKEGRVSANAKEIAELEARIAADQAKLAELLAK
jgi:hypothetical protein